MGKLMKCGMVVSLAVALTAIGCFAPPSGSSSGSGSLCGLAGQACCNGGACFAGLQCLAGECVSEGSSNGTAGTVGSSSSGNGSGSTGTAQGTSSSGGANGIAAVVEWVSSTPATIALAGSGSVTTSAVIFEAENASGGPVADGVMVTFSISGAIAGVTYAPMTAATAGGTGL